jgi:hypothetical protein
VAIFESLEQRLYVNLVGYVCDCSQLLALGSSLFAFSSIRLHNLLWLIANC